MRALNIAILAPPEESKTQEELKEAVARAAAWLGGRWRLAGPDNTDAAIVAMNTRETSRVLWEQIKNTFPADKIVVYGEGPWGGEARRGIPRPPKGGPTALSLVNVLLSLEEALAGAPPPAGLFDPAEHVQGIVEEALADGTARILSLPGGPASRLFLAPKENACYVMGGIEQAIGLCRARREAIEVEVVGEAAVARKAGYAMFSSRLSSYAALPGADLFEEIGHPKARRYSLKELVWFATLVNSGGRPLAGQNLGEPVVLRHWPEFTRLPYYRDYLHIAKQMSQDALPLAEFAARAGLPLGQVVDFHNASALLGLALAGEPARAQARRHQAARAELQALLRPHAEAGGNRLKIVIAGPVGAGKTTAISTLSDFAPLTTEARPSDAVARQKSGTTVAMDYGEVRFEDYKVFLYGTPGQRRFEFMGEILCNAAWGLLILLDGGAENPLAELDYYLALYRRALPRLKVMVGITQCGEEQAAALGRACREHLAALGARYPVARLDPRHYPDVVGYFKEAVGGAA